LLPPLLPFWAKNPSCFFFPLSTIRREKQSRCASESSGRAIKRSPVRSLRRKRCGPLRQFSLAARDRTASTYSQIRVPFRRAGIGGEVHTQESRGCATSGSGLKTTCISGPSAVGACRPTAPWSRRSILRFGAGPPRARDERATSKTHMRRLNGCAGRTVMAVSEGSSALRLNRTSVRWPRSRVGFWEFRRVLIPRGGQFPVRSGRTRRSPHEAALGGFVRQSGAAYGDFKS
jgi:hypothetical protein